LFPALLNGEVGDSVLYATYYKYITAERMEINNALEYMAIFQQNAHNDFQKHLQRRKGSYIKNFTKIYYFQEKYSLENNMFLTIDLSYSRPIFSFQQKHYIEVEFVFGYFPTFEEDGITERNVYNQIVETVNRFIKQFDEYVSKNDIFLHKFEMPIFL
jgi:hypothetical protein